jgi:ABC-type spermidine/putrescine transport system permease subunit II
VHAALSGLRGQIQVARSLAASWSMILFEIVWPQVGAAILSACGLAAMWGAGDFAVSGILANGLVTLPLLMSDLMANYRIETAELLMFPLLLIALGLYGVFRGAARHVAG